MPRTDTPRIEKICADPSWDWFLSQTGNFGNGTLRADYLLRQVFIDYQDWSIPEYWHRLDRGKNKEKKNDEDSPVQESGNLDSTRDNKVNDGEDKSDDREVSESEKIDSDKAKEKEIMNLKKYDESDDKSEESGDESCEPSDESHEENDKEAEEDEIANSLDLDISNYQTNDWLIYWFQTLYDLDIPDKIHGINIARSMELDHPHKCHAWALVDVILCGHDRPSSTELIALVSWGLRGMFRQKESLANGFDPKDVHMLDEVFPCLTKDAVPVYYTVTLMVDFKFNLPPS
ncbi:unnamed protein product [Penicillium glandicola]